MVQEPGVTADKSGETDEVGDGLHDVPAEFGAEGQVPEKRKLALVLRRKDRDAWTSTLR